MKEITFQDAQEIVRKINGKEGTRKTFADMYGMSENTLSRRLKKHGYEFDQSTKKYNFTSLENTSPKTESQEVIKTERKEESKTESKQAKKPKEQKIIKEEIQKVRKLKKVTYEIDEDVHFELRMKAFRAKRNVSELVEQAIKEYLNQ